MNTAAFVDEQIQILKNSGIPLAEAAWQAALLCVGWPYIFGDRGQYCTVAKRKAVHDQHPDQEGLVTKCQVLNGSKSSCGGCKWFPDGKRVRSFDCRGFTYWVLLQIYGWELKGAGATSQWNTESNWKAKGTVADGVPEDLLVCLFYKDKKDPKVMAHTGLGFRGKTCECSNGVQYSKTRSGKWTHWAVPACVDGDVPEPEPDQKPTLRKGDSGPYVVELQTDLISLGYDVGKTGADGKFGANTEKAVKAFQKDHPPLKVDGVCGQATWAAIEKAMEPEPEPGPKTYMVTVHGLDYAQATELAKEYPGSEIAEEVKENA